MPTDAESVGRRIAEARESGGLTQEQLANASSLERSALAKVERGLRGVSALELASLARALDRRIEWFVNVPTEAVVAHRVRAGSGSDIAAIDRALEDLAADVSFVQSLEPQLAIEIESQPRPTSMNEADQLASRARSLCGLDVNEPAEDLGRLGSSIGFFAFGLPLGSATADGGTVQLATGGVAVINSASDIGRLRLTFAHELGHYLVDDDYTVDWRVADHDGSGHTETLLDRFARAFLLPQPALEAFWRQREEANSVRDCAVLAAGHFHVDMSTLARRLREIGLVGEDVAAQVRGARTTRADIVEHGLRRPLDFEGVTLPVTYELAVLANYRRHSISAERAVSLLWGKYAFDDLPLLPVGHHDEIWSIIR